MYYIKVMGDRVEEVEAPIYHYRFRIELYVYNMAGICSPKYMQLGVF